MKIPDSALELLNSSRLVHLVTLNTDGSPQVSCVWVDADPDEIRVAHMGQGQKIKNVQRDPRVALSVVGEGHNAMGLQEYLIVKGEAHVTEGGAPQLLKRLASRYMGPEADFPPAEAMARPGRILRIRPTKLGGIGPWAAG